MAGFDYDVAIIGSRFGGSVAALRAAEKGYRGRFDIATGAVINGPATAPLNVYQVQDVAGGIRILA